MNAMEVEHSGSWAVETVGEMEPLIHDIRDLANAVEHLAATSAGRGEDIPARVGLGISTVADQIVAKAESLHKSWQDIFQYMAAHAAECSTAPKRSEPS